MLSPLTGALGPIGTASGLPAFSPSSITGLKLWLDASDAATITFGSASAVAAWTDKSVNHSAAQASAGARPTLQTAVQNGLNVVRFTGASSQRMFLSPAIDLSTARTIVCVVARGGPSGTGIVEVLGSSTATSAYGLEWWSNTNLYSSGTGRYTQSNGQASTAFNQISVDLNASAGHFYLNGALLNEDSASSLVIPGIYDCIGYGDSSYANCDMGEVLVYDSVLSSTDRQAVAAYQKAKWATP